MLQQLEDGEVLWVSTLPFQTCTFAAIQVYSVLDAWIPGK